MRHRRSLVAVAALTATSLAVVTAQAAPAQAGRAPSHAYRANDFADGRAKSILPPGENGLVNAIQAGKYFTTGKRPPHSQDQLRKYTRLLYHSRGLTNAQLHKYFLDESFGVRKRHITRAEKPGRGVTIYRDRHDIPHIYGTTKKTMAFGAGYAQAEDRLFLMDVLRHFGEGTLASFLGPSCQFEQMDHDQLLLAPYTRKRAIAQVNRLPREYGAQGRIAKSMIYRYVAGVNAYVEQTRTHPRKLPVDYFGAVDSATPRKWGVQDVVAIAGLIGGLFGRGGGIEVANARLLEYLQRTLGARAGWSAFHQFRKNNDPLAPTTVVDRRFPYEIPGRIKHSAIALPDYGARITDGTAGTAARCRNSGASRAAASILHALSVLPRDMSNALVVGARHTRAHHPLAVFGPQVSYYAPQILAQEDLHAPGYAAAGASFPGTGFVELGRGVDYAWSATSSGSDVIDQRLERLCEPGGGAPGNRGTHYLYKGKCRSMILEHHWEKIYPRPGGHGTPTVINHKIYRTVHGVVQGWTKSGGRPVAVVNQRSTYNHDVDSVVGFLRWGEPKLTHGVHSWMRGASNIQYTFNWFYVDNRDIGYFVSGRDPIRPRFVDPSLPTWGTGHSEWRGFLRPAQHVHEINPKQGYFISWNNKPAPGFAAADDQYGYGQVYRSIMLDRQLRKQFAQHHGRVTRAQVVTAMEVAASQDLDGLTVIPLLLRYLRGHHESAGVRAMLHQLRTWVATGAHRKKGRPKAEQYRHAAAVAISDELVPHLIGALYGSILKAGGVGRGPGGTADFYFKLPMNFVDLPDSHGGSSFDGGYESYLVASLQQLLHRHPRDGFGRAITRRECHGGPRTCGAAIDAALVRTHRALVKANGTRTAARWTSSVASKATGQTMPEFDSIRSNTLGLIGQPDLDWQNRPTFQQVVQFYRHRHR
jgi:acyl-homoserine lactone acylase PvdQ